MTSTTPEQQTLEALRHAARRYCDQIDQAEDFAAIQLLRRLNATLAELYFRGQALPRTEQPAVDGFDEAEGDEHSFATSHLMRYQKALNALGDRLHNRDFFLLIPDGYAIESHLRRPAMASLIDLLAVIYAGLIDLLDSEPADEAEQAWHWRSQIAGLWGLSEILPAQNAMACLLSVYWDEDETKWLEVWQPETGSL